MNKVDGMSNLLMLLFIAVISVGIVWDYFQIFLGAYKKRKANWCRWCIFFIWQIVSVSDIIKLPSYVVLIINVLVVFLLTFNYEGKILHKAVFTILYNSIWLLLEIWVINIFYALRINVNSYEGFEIILSKIILFLVVNSLKRFFCNENIRELPHSYNMALMVIPAGSMFVVYSSFMMSTHGYNIWHMFSSFASLLIMLIINILIFRIYLKLSEDLELRQKNILYEQEMDLYDKHIEEKENSMAEIRKARHDLKNQLVYLMELSENKEYTELEEFLKELIETEPFGNLTISKTENSVVDALVNYKYSIAKKYGIKFDVKLEVPIRLPYNSSDICIILGNALDNALEANNRANIENPYIKLIMRMDVKNLIIVIENSFDGHIKRDCDGNIITVKEDSINHGIGLGSIKKSVDKYHGFMKTYDKDKKFILKVVLYDNSEKVT